jgi:hypothetical protein
MAQLIQVDRHGVPRTDAPREAGLIG